MKCRMDTADSLGCNQLFGAMLTAGLKRQWWERGDNDEGILSALIVTQGCQEDTTDSLGCNQLFGAMLTVGLKPQWWERGNNSEGIPLAHIVTQGCREDTADSRSDDQLSITMQTARFGATTVAMRWQLRWQSAGSCPLMMASITMTTKLTVA